MPSLLLGRRPGLRLVPAAALVVLAACTDAPTAPRLATTATGHDPILFVHGWNSNASTWSTMVARFKADGWTSAELVVWSYNTAQSNATTAQQISAKVDSIRRVTGAARVDVVAHSMGALSARYYIKNLGGDGKVDAWVSLGGPSHGTASAYACLQLSCMEMWPGSRFLASLNAVDETPGSPRYATWASPCDELVNPLSTVVLSGATNTTTACLRHSALKEDATVYAQVRAWVQPATLAAR